MPNISPRIAGSPPDAAVKTSSSRGKGRAAEQSTASHSLLNAAIIGLAVGLLYSVLTVAYKVYSFWRSNEHIEQELSTVAPYFAFYFLRAEMLLVTLTIAVVITALGFVKFLRPILSRLVFVFAALLLVEIGIAGWVGFKVISSADRLNSALNFSDNDFFALFDLSQPGLTSVRESVEAGNYGAAKEVLIVYFEDKFKSLASEALSRGDSLQTMTIAEQAVNNTFDLLAITKTLPKDIDWHHGFEEDREWIFFLNRMLWQPALGKAYHWTKDPRYAQTFVAQFQDWLKDNPLPKWKDENSPSWRLIEAGRRLWDSWIEAFQLFISSPEVPVDLKLQMLKSIHDHAQFLTCFRTKFNHLLVESDGLLNAACLFPEFKRAPVWQKMAMDRLSAELSKQIYPDGAHAELAFGYHLLCLSHFYFPVKMAEKYPLLLPRGYSDRLQSMIDFLLLSQKPDERLPLINDTNEMDVQSFLDDFRETFDRPDLLFAATNGAQGQPPEKISVEFPYSGYYIMRSDWTPSARYLIFDAGSYGGFHGHEDKLSFEMSAYGTPMITDAGAYAYTGDVAFRAYFVSTWAHNTALIDGLGQNRYLYNQYKMSTRADRAQKLTDARWASTGEYDYAAGSYNDGYSTMSAKGRGANDIETSVTHDRQIFFVKPDYWVVVDKISGSGAHQVELLFHMTPDAEATVVDQQVQAKFGNGAALQIFSVNADSPLVSIVKGSIDPIQGWVATGYNKKVPAATAVFKHQVELPATLYTVLIPSSSIDAARFQIAAAKPDSAQTNASVVSKNSFSISGSTWDDFLVFPQEGVEPESDDIIDFHRLDKAGSVIRKFSINKL